MTTCDTDEICMCLNTNNHRTIIYNDNISRVTTLGGQPITIQMLATAALAKTTLRISINHVDLDIILEKLIVPENPGGNPHSCGCSGTDPYCVEACLNPTNHRALVLGSELSGDATWSVIINNAAGTDWADLNLLNKSSGQQRSFQLKHIKVPPDVPAFSFIERIRNFIVQIFQARSK